VQRPEDTQKVYAREGGEKILEECGGGGRSEEGGVGRTAARGTGGHGEWGVKTTAMPTSSEEMAVGRRK